MMKNLSLVLNLILFIAVGVLFYWHFSEKKTGAKEDVPHKTITKADGGAALTVAYVDYDSLNEKINYIKENRKALESEQQSIETEWENGYRNMQNQKNNFLKRGNAITQEEAEAFQNSLMQQQQQVDSKKQSLSQQLNEKTYKFMDGIQKRLKSFLEEYNKDKRFSYIFTVGNGLDYMIYKDSALDITSDVISGMNEIFEEERSKK